MCTGGCESPEVNRRRFAIPATDPREGVLLPSGLRVFRMMPANEPWRVGPVGSLRVVVGVVVLTCDIGVL